MAEPIKRYFIHGHGHDTRQDDDGDIVYYDDHLAAVLAERERCELWKRRCEYLAVEGVDECWMENVQLPDPTEPDSGWLDRLDVLIDAELRCQRGEITTTEAAAIREGEDE